MSRSSLASTAPTAAFAAGDPELMLPWHATATLDQAGTRRVAFAMARDPSLAQEYQAIQRERDAVVDLNEQIGAPSLRPMLALFAAIESDAARAPKVVAFKIPGATRYAAGPKFRRVV